MRKELEELKKEVASGKENLEMQKAEISRLSELVASYEEELDSVQVASSEQFERPSGHGTVDNLYEREYVEFRINKKR